MTWGEQNTLEEGVEQLHVAFDEFGLNFIDTVEMLTLSTAVNHYTEHVRASVCVVLTGWPSPGQVSDSHQVRNAG